MPKQQQDVVVKSSFLAWLLGMCIASIFSMAYLLIPIYLLTATASLLHSPTSSASILYAMPMLISILVPPRSSLLALRLIHPMLSYFDFESIYHLDSESTIRNSMNNGTSYIFAAQPHGVLSFVGMCAAASNPNDTLAVPTAAASVVLRTPLLKNLMGIFNLVDASAHNLQKLFLERKSVLIYIGGIAELFKSCRTEERLYLQQRKGFIKLALKQTNVDIVPVYLFGNTSVLSVMKHGPLAALSRKLQASLTLFWGKCYLPIPRDETLLYVIGKPLGLPYIPNPTQEDIDKWHGIYCEEVRKIFEMYKERVPTYKHKKLYID